MDTLSEVRQDSLDVLIQESKKTIATEKKAEVAILTQEAIQDKLKSIGVSVESILTPLDSLVKKAKRTVEDGFQHEPTELDVQMELEHARQTGDMTTIMHSAFKRFSRNVDSHCIENRHGIIGNSNEGPEGMTNILFKQYLENSSLFASSEAKNVFLHWAKLAIEIPLNSKSEILLPIVELMTSFEHAIAQDEYNIASAALSDMNKDYEADITRYSDFFGRKKRAETMLQITDINTFGKTGVVHNYVNYKYEEVQKAKLGLYKSGINPTNQAGVLDRVDVAINRWQRLATLTATAK